jgi:hypothetical protein
MAAGLSIQDQVDPEVARKRTVLYANALWRNVVMQPAFRLSPVEKRHQIFLDNAGEFFKTYPIVCIKMILELSYNEKAFNRLLDDLRDKPGKGMSGFCANQANYVMYLYIEIRRAAGKHYDYKIAQRIRNEAERGLLEEQKQLEKEENDAKNMFEEEAKRHEIERRKRLAEFVLYARQRHPVRDYSDLTPEELALKCEMLGIDEPVDPEDDSEIIDAEPIESTDSVDLADLRRLYVRTMSQVQELEIQNGMADDRIDALLAAHKRGEKLVKQWDTESWLVGTSARPVSEPGIIASKHKRKGKK